MNTPSSRHTYPSKDGETLHYKSWIPEGGYQHALILLHRGHEHADRWDELIPYLSLPNTAIFAWEARGHGQSTGRRGHAPCFMSYVRDLETFVCHLENHHGLAREHTVMLAHSVGAVVAATWVHDYAPPLAGLVLATPAFKVNLVVPGALTAIRLTQKLKQDLTIKSYVRGSWLTRDEVQQQKYDADLGVSKDISALILVDLFDTARRVIEDASAMEVPLMLISAGDDQVVKNSAISHFLFNYGGQDISHLHLHGSRHGVFHDLDRDQLCQSIREFAVQRYNQPCAKTTTNGNRFTRAEYERLQIPLKGSALKRVNFAIQKWLMKTLGKTSQGIRLGWETGFDSGQSLDYVYQNESRGITPIGKLIDRSYLNAIGWKGIRQRREMMRDGLSQALEATDHLGLPRTLVDIAGGGGRYLLDILKEDDSGLQVLCRDWSEGALEVGRNTAKSWGLEHRIRFEKRDAFDEESLSQMQPQPSVAVVSGLYELFADNERLQCSLRGLYRVMPVNGYLVYTNQPWHPQVEMIARVLINREGKPWIMRRRPQSEMDALVSEAGFKKITQWTDDFGIFTVSIARKLNH